MSNMNQTEKIIGSKVYVPFRTIVKNAARLLNPVLEVPNNAVTVGEKYELFTSTLNGEKYLIFKKTE